MKEIVRTIIVSILTLEARAVLRKYHPKLIVVTGSVGKTSAKDATYTALKSTVFVRKSEKNYNGDIGVPLTVLGVPNGWSNMVQWIRNIIDGALLLLLVTPYPRWLIVEVGADRPGDISRGLSWVKPDVVLATRFPNIPVHVEFYATPEDVVREELFPISQLQEGGVAVVNADDPHASVVSVPSGARRMTYGFDAPSDVHGSHLRVLAPGGQVSGVSFDVTHGGDRAHVTLPGVLGRPHAYAALAGIAAALAAGAPLTEAVQFESHTPPPGRMRIIAGLNGATLVDDTYNASPIAVEEALSALREAPASRRIAVIADMLELGAYSVGEHERIGAVAASADILVTVGVRAQGFAVGAKKAGMNEDAIHTYERGSDAAAYLLSILKEGDLVLIKGSQSMRMERVVKALMLKPDDAKHLLCRQDVEWLGR